MWLPNNVRHGPKTEDVEIRGMAKRYGPTDIANNFMYAPDTDPDGFDAVNTMAMVQRVVNMYRRALRRTGRQERFQWFWGKEPVQVWPHAGEMANAFYQRDDKALVFFYFRDEKRDKMVYTCRSWDMVAHEAAHGVLDSFHPQWLLDAMESPQTGALNESFGDITAILGLLEQLDMCDTVVSETKANLRTRNNFLASLGEEYGAAFNLTLGIRNAEEHVTMLDVTDDIYDLSRVFTGAIYDVIVRIFENQSNLYEYEPAETLHNAGTVVCNTFIQAFIDAPDSKATFRDVAEKIIEHEKNLEYRKYYQEEFDKRYIFAEASLLHRRDMVDGVEAEPVPRVYTANELAVRVCGTGLAAGLDIVKAKIHRCMSVVCEHEKGLEVEEGEAIVDPSNEEGAIVHLPWRLTHQLSNERTGRLPVSDSTVCSGA